MHHPHNKILMVFSGGHICLLYGLLCSHPSKWGKNQFFGTQTHVYCADKSFLELDLMAVVFIIEDSFYSQNEAKIKYFFFM